MNLKLLIDGIVQQTTVLIAQLSTTAGVRAPLAHIADQVFLSLSREIEAQGVGRKVVADMFGLALRGYQKKTQRLAASQTAQGRTLFEAVLEYIGAQGGATRGAILERFRHDGERQSIGVLTDLVASGLVYATGSGSSTLYGVTSDAQRQRFTRVSDEQTLADVAWGAIYRNPNLELSQLAHLLLCEPESAEQAVRVLVADGRVTRCETGAEVRLRAAGFQIPVGAERGWESAVFDHYQAVATAIANKLKLASEGIDANHIVGGTTLRFELSDNHPHKQEVLGLLNGVRKQATDVWERVSDYNDSHPIDDEQRFNVCFYFGQNTDSIERCDVGSHANNSEDDEK